MLQEKRYNSFASNFSQSKEINSFNYYYATPDLDIEWSQLKFAWEKGA